MNRKRIHLFPLRIFTSLCGLLAVSAMMVGLSGCGGSSKPISVTVTAASSNVDGNDSTTVTATVANDKNSAGVTWTVSGGGTLSNETKTSATYTAPAATSSSVTATVRATSVANTQKSGTATIVVPAMPTLTTTATQLAGQVGSAYSVQLQGSGGIPPYVNWAVANEAGNSVRRASVAGGVLPPCVTLSSGGLLSSATAPPASCAGTYANIVFTFSDSGTPTPLTATTSPMTITIAAAPAITFPAASAADPGPGTYGAAYSGSVAATGGAGTLTYTLNGALPGGLTLGATGTITGKPTAVGTFPFTVTASDAYGDTATSPTYSITVSYGALAITPGAGSLPGGTVGTAYSQTLTASGGSGTGYTWTVTGLPIAGLDYTADGATLTISGMPTSAESVSFTAAVEDSASNTAGPYTYTIVLGSNTGGSALEGTYTCAMQGYFDATGDRFVTITSFEADGNGNLTGGVFDSNSRAYTAAVSGTLTGTYTVGADGNGTASTTSVWTASGTQQTSTVGWAISVAKSASPAQQMSLVENDDTGSTPSGQHAVGSCRLDTPSAFTASTLNGTGWVWASFGETSTGVAKASAGELAFATSGMTVTGGTSDNAKAGNSSLNTNTITGGSFTTPDATTGRTPLSLTLISNGVSGTSNFALYLSDSKHAMVLETDAIGSTFDLFAAVVQRQQESAYTAANLNGAFVFYTQGLEFGSSNTTPTGEYSIIYQGTGNGTGSLSIAQSYMDDTGVYSAGQATGSTSVSFDSSVPGRATIAGGSGTIVLYFFDTNNAFEVSGGGSGGSSVESGRVEPQTQTTFTDAALAGTYAMSEMMPLEASALDLNGELTVGSDGSLQGQLTDAGEADYHFDQSLSGTYAWDTSVTGTGTFLAPSPYGWSCAVINSARFVCTDQTANPPAMRVFQQ